MHVFMKAVSDAARQHIVMAAHSSAMQHIFSSVGNSGEDHHTHTELMIRGYDVGHDDSTNIPFVANRAVNLSTPCAVLSVDEELHDLKLPTGASGRQPTQ
jgi:hypothetical protein